MCVNIVTDCRENKNTSEQVAYAKNALGLVRKSAPRENQVIKFSIGINMLEIE